MKLPLNYKTGLAITLITVCGALEVWLITIPSLQTIKAIRTDIEDQVNRANLLLLQGQTINRLREDIERITPFLERFNEIFIRPEDQLNFIVSLEELAKRQKVAADLSLNDLPKASKDDIVSVPLTMQIQGTFPELILFLGELQRLNFYVNIKTISLLRAPSEGEVSLTSTLRSLTYWQLSPQ